MLGQIEGKPRGDLLGAKERSQTGEAEALRKAPWPDVGLSLATVGAQALSSTETTANGSPPTG